MGKASSLWHGIRFTAIGSLSKGISLFNREWGRQYLVREISSIPGLPAKAAQILNMKYGNPDWLRHQGMALPLEWVKHRIEMESPDLARSIVEISDEGMTASLGQVHWAKLKDGREVGIKVQYPGVKKQIEDQLELLLSAMDLVPSNRKYGLDVESYRTFFRDLFMKETDYIHEMENQNVFRSAFPSSSGILIPEVYPEFTTETLLVQSFEPCSMLDELCAMDPKIKKNVSLALSKLMIVGALRLGLVHTDLHQRNWGFRPDTNTLVLYDFGAVLRLDNTLRLALQNLLFSPDDSATGCLQRMGALGFDIGKLSNIAHQLPELLDLLTEPFVANTVWKPHEWKLNDRIEAILGGDKWWFRVAGAPWFLFLMRGLYGGIQALERLGESVDTNKILVEGVGIGAGFSNMEDRQTKHIQLNRESARYLRVVVTEGADTVVDLELPSRAVEDLEEVMPEHVGEKLRELGVNISEIKKNAITTGLVPQELFQADSGKRHYRVWLE